MLLLIGAFAAVSTALAIWLSEVPVGQPDPRNWVNAFYVIFARDEPVGLALVLLFTAVTGLWLQRGAPGWIIPIFLNKIVSVTFIALGVFILTAAGAWLVFHGYAFTADEYMADFQARLFAAGKIQQEVPEFWRPMLRLIAPTFAIYRPETHSWMSSYLPVYAAIRSLFMRAGLEWMTNCVMASVSIYSIAAIVRRLWPDDAWKPLLAGALLAASPQFLITSMTGYSMPAHLALNLLWLWLYCDPQKRRFWLAPLVGVAAMGLHQPFVHALFATPFLVRLVLERRWKAVFWFAGVYIAGIACWWSWWHHFVPGNAGGAAGTFGLADRTLLIQMMNLGLLIGWLALPVPLLALLGFGRVRKQQPLLFDAALSCCLTFGFYVFVQIDQGHGWGYRYIHGALGCLILVAVAGWDSLSERLGRASAVTFAVAGIAAAMLVQVPTRAVQAQSIVRPFATASAELHAPGPDVVVFDPRHAWYLADLRRNDPLFRQRPVIVASMTMSQKEKAALQQQFPNGRAFTAQDFRRFGMQMERYP